MALPNVQFNTIIVSGENKEHWAMMVDGNPMVISAPCISHQPCLRSSIFTLLMADDLGVVPTVNAGSNGASTSGGRRAEEARICRCVRRSMRKVGLGQCYNWLWGIRRTEPPTPAPSPIPRRDRTQKVQRPSRRQQALLPFLSRSNGHLAHNKCFETHLIDAIRLNTFLSQIESEQVASDRAFDAFQSDLVLSEIRTQAYKRDKPLYRELVARIAAAKTGKINCTEGDIDRDTKLLCIRASLRVAMEGVFGAFDETIEARPPPAPVTNLDVAVAKARACWQRLRTDRTAYLELEKDNGTVRGSPEYSAARKVRIVAKKSLEATEKTYRVLENELLANVGVSVLGVRASLVQPMSEENMSKLSKTLKTLPRAGVSTQTPGNFIRRPGRDLEGRPPGARDEDVPAIEDRSIAYVRSHRTYLARRRAILEPLTQLRTEFENAIADYRLLHPNADHRTYNRQLTSANGRPFLNAIQERSDQLRALTNQHDLETEEITQTFGYRMAFSLAGFSGGTFDSNKSDGNTVTENYAERIERLQAIESNTIRTWNRTVVESTSSGDVNEIDVSVPSSDQVMRPLSMNGYADYGDESVTERNLILKGGWEARTDMQRRLSAIERLELLNPVGSGRNIDEE